ncbi:hypothetical protein LCGC14_1982690 [marine sediment metagenome]|uniref:Uncharacterized protein n=1 Tax=marine sediment metagenome TaxID=412755 RepID=A0A0F9FWL8_9ZZZZ
MNLLKFSGFLRKKSKAMYRIESTIVEELKEQDLNADDLLQAHTKKYTKQKIEVVRRIVEDEEFITTFFDNKIEIVRK